MKNILTFDNLFLGVMLLTMVSCSYTSKLTDRQIEIQHAVNKLSLEYHYQRDSLIMEYYRKDGDE